MHFFLGLFRFSKLSRRFFLLFGIRCGTKGINRRHLALESAGNPLPSRAADWVFSPI